MKDFPRAPRCWMGSWEDAENRLGSGSDEFWEWWAANSTDGGLIHATCMLESGHDGPHEFTPNDEIFVIESGGSDERPKRGGGTA